MIDSKNMLSSSSGVDKERNWKRILLVDDEPDITFTLKMGLEGNGDYQVDTFNDPQEALSKFRPRYYNLLISDIKMPNLNGFEFYSKIRKLDDKIRVCFITGYEYYYDEFRRVFPKLNVKCFANKPVSIDKLVEIIREELSAQQAYTL